jgi:hypothetical protein
MFTAELKVGFLRDPWAKTLTTNLTNLYRRHRIINPFSDISQELQGDELQNYR